jgi:hypothetical protein
MSDNKKVAIDYLYTFYLDLKQLNNQYATYLNYLKELQFLLNGNDLSNSEMDINGIDETYIKDLMVKVQQARYYITQINLQFNIISKKIKIKEQEQLNKLKEIYNKLNNKFIFNLDDFYSYVLLINELVFESVIEELLTNQNEILKEMYSERETS